MTRVASSSKKKSRNSALTKEQREIKRITKMIPGFDTWKTKGDCDFNFEKAEIAVDFFHSCIRHVKGSLAGEVIQLELWQQAIIYNLYGWYRPDGTRRFRECFIFVPRKNGKTTILAGLVLFMLFCDHEPGAEIYSAAADREQASLVYEQAKNMMFADSDMSRLGTVNRSYKSIVYNGTNSSYKAVSAEAETKHGYNAHFIVIDELHAIPKPDLVDVLLTSTGSRRQPLVVYITTSDYDRESVCNTKYDYAAKIRDGIISDYSFLPVIYEASRDDDWRSVKTWKKANPNFGISISKDYLKRECQRAIDSPVYENTFKRLHLNIRTEQDVRWLQMDKWDACSDSNNPDELRGQDCYAGLDLSSKKDITALVLLFPDAGNVVVPFFWLPEDTAGHRERKDRVPYLTWSREGYIELTEGNVVDYRYIRQRVNELAKVYNIKDIAFDPWNAMQLALQMQEEDGLNMVEFRQGTISMNEPAKYLEALILKGNLKHGGNPVLRWMASNVTVKSDPSNNIRIDKEKSAEKVDGIVALCMAIGRMIVSTQEPPSVYDTRGILSL